MQNRRSRSPMCYFRPNWLVSQPKQSNENFRSRNRRRGSAPRKDSRRMRNRRGMNSGSHWIQRIRVDRPVLSRNVKRVVPKRRGSVEMARHRNSELAGDPPRLPGGPSHRDDSRKLRQPGRADFSRRRSQDLYRRIGQNQRARGPPAPKFRIRRIIGLVCEGKTNLAQRWNRALQKSRQTRRGGRCVAIGSDDKRCLCYQWLALRPPSNSASVAIWSGIEKQRRARDPIY